MNSFKLSALFVWIPAVLAGCSQDYKDASIKADLTVRAKTIPSFAGVKFTVNKGSVFLMGSCPSQTDKNKVRNTAWKIAGVEQVIDSTYIAPVILDEHFWLQQSVDSLLAYYPRVVGKLRGKNLLLSGTLKDSELKKVEEGLQSLPLSSITRQIIIKKK